MIPAWRAFLLEHQAEWRLPAGSDWNYVFHNNYHPHHSNINVLWFRGHETFPRVVAKIYKSPETPKREFANLKQAHQRARLWAPEPLYFGCHEGFWMLWMHGIPGSRPRVIDGGTLTDVVSMVGELHAALRTGLPATEHADRHARHVERPLAALRAFGHAESVIDGCERLANEASPSWVASLARIPQHGDLYIDNLLCDGRQWYLTDWEIFGEIDLPAYDLFTFLYSALRRGPATPEAWDPSLTAALPALVDRYMKRVDLPPDRSRLLLPLALVNWFHVQWADGRREFANTMYEAIRHYFEHPEYWEKVFMGRPTTAGQRRGTTRAGASL